MQRIPAVPHSSCETDEYRWIRALPYSPFHVESRSWLYWSSRHWPSAIRMPRMVVTSAQSVESREIPVQSTAIGRKLNPATVGRASLRVARCSNRLHMPFRRHRPPLNLESHKRAAYAHYQGGRGYQPMIALWAEADLIVADQLHDGNVPAKREPLSCCQMAFEALPETVRERYFRGDSACYENNLLDWLSSPQREQEPGGRRAHRLRHQCGNESAVGADHRQECGYHSSSVICRDCCRLPGPYGMNAVNADDRLTPPSAVYWLGTDNLGRDLLSHAAPRGRPRRGSPRPGARRSTGPASSCCATPRPSSPSSPWASRSWPGSSAATCSSPTSVLSQKFARSKS